MAPTYMDRCDMASGFTPTRSRPISEDPRYFNGALYNTVIDRMVAEAKHTLRIEIARLHRHHANMICAGFTRAFNQLAG